LHNPSGNEKSGKKENKKKVRNVKKRQKVKEEGYTGKRGRKKGGESK